ncbi:hypothetical protein D3C80_1846770 [compost metagenome]
MAGCQFQYQLFVQWLHKAHIHQGGVERFRYLRGFRQQCAEIQDRQLFTFTTDNAFADRQRVERFQRCTGTIATRITHGAWAFVIVIAGVQHLTAFVFITWRHDHHGRDATHK